jgi:hypothetical protein
LRFSIEFARERTTTPVEFVKRFIAAPGLHQQVDEQLPARFMMRCDIDQAPRVRHGVAKPAVLCPSPREPTQRKHQASDIRFALAIEPGIEVGGIVDSQALQQRATIKFNRTGASVKRIAPTTRNALSFDTGSRRWRGKHRIGIGLERERIDPHHRRGREAYDMAIPFDAAIAERFAQFEQHALELVAALCGRLLRPEQIGETVTRMKARFECEISEQGSRTVVLECRRPPGPLDTRGPEQEQRHGWR